MYEKGREKWGEKWGTINYGLDLKKNPWQTTSIKYNNILPMSTINLNINKYKIIDI